MDSPNPHIINEIAQNIDCGYDCYFNPETKEIIAIPNLAGMAMEEEFIEAFQEDLDKVGKNESDYIKIEVLESFESFGIMENFVGQMPDERLKFDLEEALRRGKPFRNFKHLIDDSEYRQTWFDFKRNELEKIVEKRLSE